MINGGSRSRRLISIIIPSYNDPRILAAIDSVRAFDDAEMVSIVVIDGGSSPDVVAGISASLTEADVLVSEPDRGIFDALNKGLEAATTAYIGWIGSDDVLTGDIKASEVVRRLEDADLFVAVTVHVKGGVRKRVTRSWPVRMGLVRFGLNNPHFSTFGRSELLKRERFSLELRGSDVDYFLRIFNSRPKVSTSSRVCTLMEEGGYSNSGIRSIMKTNFELLRVYRAYSSWPIALMAVAAKLGSKCLSVVACKVHVRRYSRV